MPRGQTSRANRKYKRACASGSSTKGSSTAAVTQTRGRKYKKKETSSHIGIDIKTIVYDGLEYDIHYYLKENRLMIHNVQKKNKDFTLKSVHNNEINDQELKMKIIDSFIKNTFKISN